jgi:hypothetical protein
MSRKGSKNTEPSKKEELLPVREFKDYFEVANLKEEDIAKLSLKEKQILLDRLIELIPAQEKEGYHTRANILREKMYFLAENHLTVEGGVEDFKRQDWEINHIKILSFIHNHVLNNNSFPAINTISNGVELSRQTVHAHLREGINNKFYQERLKTWEALTDSIYKNLYYQAIQNGNIQASKILLDNIYRDKQPQTIKQQNNYIQINNTKIDELTIAELPDVAKEKIVEIVNQYTIKKAI